MEVRPVSGSDMLRTVRLRTSDTQIREVVITATQVRGPVSGVHIGRDAMNHIQPSSFGDLLELLPGGRASDPSFSSSNHIHLREIGTSNSDYQTTSLGVSFVMDGIPMSNDAGMTYNSGTTVGNNISLNRGVDMRTMPTDEIASVEIQQGIPSVEYGDLTSGLIKIKRKEGGRNLEARFKADLGSQLLYVGKGFEWGAPADLLTMNVGATWLNSHDDPRNTRQNYQRATGSWRMKKRWESTSAYRYTLGGSLDYTGSFDRQKSDRDIDEGPAGIPLERIIGKTKCDGIQNQMRLFGGRVSPKRKATKISHTHTKSTVRMAFDCRSNGVLHQVEPMPAPPHSPKYPPSNRDACARSS